MDIETVIRESQAENLVEQFQFKTETGKKQFSKQLRFFTENELLLRRRQNAILELQKSLTIEKQKKLDSLFVEVATLEPQLNVFFEKSDVEKNSYEQLTFSSWISTQILNTIPFVLLCLSFFKLYLVPLFAVLMPVFMLFAPYFILLYWYKLPLSFDQYKNLLLSMIGIQSEQFWSPKNILQFGLTTFSIVQGMVQPVQNALHLQTIHKDLVEKGKCVEQIASILKELGSLLPVKNPYQDICESFSDPHRSFADAWDSPFRLQYSLELLGDAEVLYCLAKSNLKPVVFTKTTGFSFVNASDPLFNNSIPFTVECTPKKNHHCILTGPNRGGKSSFLRATLLNIVLAQTFGFCSAELAFLKPIHWIATGLRLEDRPGKSSMFEREVEFAVAILKKAKENPKQTGLVLFDELFHSTNPPDGSRTAKLFLEKIWRLPNVVSIISTHVFDIAKNAPQNVNRLCVPAEQKENGELHFTYTLQSGVCEVSSVDIILREKGLLESA
jgi:hypothetical protein